jgi:hypothetical protein
MMKTPLGVIVPGASTLLRRFETQFFEHFFFTERFEDSKGKHFLLPFSFDLRIEQIEYSYVELWLQMGCDASTHTGCTHHD